MRKEELLLKDGQCALEHSRELDKRLGIASDLIESRLSDVYQHYYGVGDNEGKKKLTGTQNAWFGLDAQILQTPYHECFEILEFLEEFNLKSIVDIGAGYGRFGIVAEILQYDYQYYGYEIVPERVQEAQSFINSHDLKKTFIECQNVLDSSFAFPKASVFMLYDFSNPQDISTILHKLSDIWGKEKQILILRGKAAHSLVSNKFREFQCLGDPVYFDKWTGYKSFD